MLVIKLFYVLGGKYVFRSSSTVTFHFKTWMSNLWIAFGWISYWSKMKFQIKSVSNLSRVKNGKKNLTYVGRVVLLYFDISRFPRIG